MQSCVWMALASSQGGAAGGGMCGCAGRRGSGRRAQRGGGAASSSRTASPLPSPPPISPGGGGSGGGGGGPVGVAQSRFPPPRYRSSEHVPAASANSKQACVLTAKRLLLSRAHAAAGPLPNSGEPREEKEENVPTPLPDKAGVSGLEDIDLQQFKSVRVVSGPASSASRRLHKLYLDLHSTGGDDSASSSCTYKMHFASARERDVWAEILAAYGEYREYGAAAGKDAASPPSLAASASDPAVAAATAVAIAAAVPYCAYTIPAIYVRALQSCFDALVSSRAFEREGLFRTGRSSPLLMRQLLLNNGLLEGGRWGRKAGLAAAGPGLGLDPHTVAFVAKSLLRSLPETLLTNALLQHLFRAAGRSDSALLIALLHRLPASNSLVLQRLFEVMALTLACPSSRMTCDSLTKVVGPNLLPKDDVAWIRGMTGGPAPVAAQVNGDAAHGAGANASSSSSSGGSSTSANASDPTHFATAPPSPGSLPMLQLFSMVFEHAQTIWPSSAVFAPGGVGRILSPPELAVQHSGVVRLHASEGQRQGEEADTDFSWEPAGSGGGGGTVGAGAGGSFASFSAPWNSVAQQQQQQHAQAGGGGVGGVGGGVHGSALPLSPVAEEALSRLSPSQTPASSGAHAHASVAMDTRSPTITATNRPLQQHRLLQHHSSAGADSPVRTDATVAAASFAAIAAESTPVPAAPAASSSSARRAEMELTALSVAPKSALSIEPSLGLAGSRNDPHSDAASRMPFPRSTTPSAVRFHSWRSISPSGLHPNGHAHGHGQAGSSAAAAVVAPVVPVVLPRVRSLSPPRRAGAHFEREQEREVVRHEFPFPRFHEGDDE